MIQYTAQLDFTDNGVFETGWRLKQGDFGDCAIIFKVVNNGEDMYDSQITPTIAFKRADGKSIVSQMQDNNGTYKYVFVGNELAVPGSVVCDVKYEDASGRTSTASCRFTVLEDTIGYDPTGAATYNNPVSVIAEGAKVNSLTSEGYALGTQNGDPVAEDSPYYHNNSKYYCERAEGYTPEWYQDLMDDIDYYEEQGFISKNLFKVSVGTAPATITYTKNSDDSLTISNDGTNVSEAALLLGSYLLKGNQTIKFVGCPSSGGDNSYRLDLRESSSSVLVSDSGSGNTYTNPTAVDKTVYLYARFAANYSANSLSFKPMISTDTDIAYDDYMPYAPSNREITKYTLTGTIVGGTQKIYLNGDDGSSQYVSIIAPNDINKADVDTLAYVENNNPSTFDPASRDYAKGEHFILWGDFCTAITDIAEGAFLQENVNYKKDNVGDALEKKISKDASKEKTTTTGKFSTINGGKLKSCIVAFEPVQSGSGTPSPSNVRPITGHSSVEVDVNNKNYLPLPTATTKNGITLVQNDDGSLTITGTASANTYFDFSSDFDSTRFSGYTLYLISEYTGWSNSTVRARVASQGYSTTYQNLGANSTIDDNGSGLVLTLRIGNGFAIPTGGINIKPMLVKNAEESPVFVPYNGTDYTTPLSTTVYGGNIDVVSGSGKAKYVDIDLSAQTWSYNSASDRKWFTCTVSDVKATPNSQIADMYCECYEPSTRNDIIADPSADSLIAINTAKNIIIRDLRFTDPTDLVNALSGMHLIAERDTYADITCTPQQINALVGENNLDTPLTGQSLTSAIYKDMFTWNDVLDAINSALSS